MAEQDLLQGVDALAAAALGRWGLGGAPLRMINHSENFTYLVTPPTAPKVILRVHREDYHTVNGIRSELAWMRALQSEAGVKTPQAIAGRDGADIQTVTHPALPRPRNCVLFDFIEGSEPSQQQLVEPFRQLGEVTARTHRHSRGWGRPPWFERLTWDFAHSLGATPNWGPWTEGPDLDAERRRLLQRLVDVVQRRLAAFGQGPERFGLIHADFRLANLLVYQGDVRVIDFDDCGLGWFLYDAATAVTLFEHSPEVDGLMQAWLEGYRRVGQVSAAEENELWTFIMMRRMTIFAWIGSHSTTELARTEGPAYSEHTCALAERYLGRFG
jgi:Ser/Thr protein kinase RdoA (MazF antagonist)